MRTLIDLGSLLSLGSFAGMRKPQVLLPALAGAFALSFNYKSRAKRVANGSASETRLQLPIMKCKPGTYEDSDKPMQH